MDYFDSLTAQRIDSETADLVDSLVERYVPTLKPCAVPLNVVLEQIREDYPLNDLPPDSIHYARTALAVIEASFPDDADYLPFDPDERLHAARALARTLPLNIYCMEVLDADAGHKLYERQKAQFEKRTAGFGLTWMPMPVRICAETNTGYCLITGSDILTDYVTCLRGVSQEDIDTRTPVLIAYLRAKYGAEGV